jgi:glycosyltransferase involved in cell wall biosynthesis
MAAAAEEGAELIVRPRLALVSTGIRRDLIAPLRYFTKFEIVHFYRRADYGDLTPADLDVNLHSYSSAHDLYRQLVRARPDVIQGVEPFSLALQACLWACYLAAGTARSRLLAVTLENRPLNIKFGRMMSFLLRRVLRVYFRRVCLVIVLNEGARRNVEACGVAPSSIQKLMWGTWGTDLDEFSPQPRTTDQPPTILFAGRLHEEKGIFVLLDAFARVRSTMPEARLVVVGDGPARQEVEQRATAMNGVTLTGVVKNRAMPEAFRAADVVAMPSLTTRKWEEQVGMVALQAMACGVPVVATPSGAIPEYVPSGVAGLLVPENDAGALANALIQLLSTRQLREQLARGARAYACDHYDASKNVATAERAVMEHCYARRV